MTAQITLGKHPMDAADAQRRVSTPTDSDISTRDTHDELGRRVMIRFGTAGLLVLFLGLGLPWLFSAWGSLAAPPGAEHVPTNDAPGFTSTPVLVAGIGLLMLATLAGMTLGPFSRVQQKYGTLAALVAFAIPLLLFAAILTMAFQ